MRFPRKARQRALEGDQVDGLDEVIVESSHVRALRILRLAIARQRNKSHAVQSGG